MAGFQTFSRGHFDVRNRPVHGVVDRDPNQNPHGLFCMVEGYQQTVCDRSARCSVESVIGGYKSRTSFFDYLSIMNAG